MPKNARQVDAENLQAGLVDRQPHLPVALGRFDIRVRPAKAFKLSVIGTKVEGIQDIAAEQRAVVLLQQRIPESLEMACSLRVSVLPEILDHLPVDTGLAGADNGGMPQDGAQRGEEKRAVRGSLPHEASQQLARIDDGER